MIGKMIFHFIFFQWAFSVTLAVDLFLSRLQYPWGEGMQKMPCDIVDEDAFSQIEGKEVHIRSQTGKELLALGSYPIEVWIGAYFTYQSEIKFSGTCYNVEDDVNLNRTKMPEDRLLKCYVLCSNSSFFNVGIQCFCEKDVKNKYGSLDLYDSCEPLRCTINKNDYSCGRTLAVTKGKDRHCMCLYSSKEISTLTWGFDVSIIPRQNCVKVIIGWNKVIKYSPVPCSVKHHLLCSNITTQNFDSTPNATPHSPRTVNITSAPLLPKTDGLLNDSDIPVYVGAGSGSAVVVLVLLLIICLVRRRNKSRNRFPLNDRVDYLKGTNSCQNEEKLDTSEKKKVKSNDLQYHNKTDVTGRCINNAVSASRDRNADTGNSTDATVYNFLHEEEKRPNEQHAIYDHVPNTEDGEYHTLGATISRNDLQARSGVHQATYDHVPNTRDGEYHTLGATNSRNDPQELSDYDSMVADEYHTLDKSTTKHIPKELSDYDSMRREEYDTIEIANTAGVRHVNLSDYDTMNERR